MLLRAACCILLSAVSPPLSGVWFVVVVVVWGDHIEIQAMAEIYDRPCEIYAYSTSEQPPSFLSCICLDLRLTVDVCSSNSVR